MGVITSFGRKVKHFFTKWSIVNKDKYRIIPNRELIFRLTPRQREIVNDIIRTEGTVEYTFYPCGGILWGLKVKVWKTGAYYDITDLANA